MEARQQGIPAGTWCRVYIICDGVVVGAVQFQVSGAAPGILDFSALDQKVNANKSPVDQASIVPSVRPSPPVGGDLTLASRRPGKTPPVKWPDPPPSAVGDKPRWNPNGYWEGPGGRKIVWDPSGHGSGTRGHGSHWDEDGVHGRNKIRWDENGKRLPYSPQKVYPGTRRRQRLQVA